LAVGKGRPLGVNHIGMSLTAMSMFEMDFAEDAAEDEDSAMLPFGSKRRREP
jgi:hypothetical protein